MDNELLIYQSDNGEIKIDVRMGEETVWLTQDQMATLFGKAKSTINEHLKTSFQRANWQQIQLFGISEQLLPTAKTTIRISTTST